MQTRSPLIATALLGLCLPTVHAVEVEGDGDAKDHGRSILVAMLAGTPPGAAGPAEGPAPRQAAVEKGPASAGLASGGDAGVLTHSDVEPNDSCASASAWPAGASGAGTGVLSSTDTQDHMRFEALRTERITVSETPPAGSDFDLALYSPSCAYVTSSTLGGSLTDTIGGWASSANGFWRQRVYHFSGPSGVYSVGFSLAPNDAGTNADAPDTSGSGPLLGAGTASGSVGRGSDMDDHYLFAVPALTKVTVTLTPDCYGSFDADLALSTNAGAAIGSSGLGGCAADAVSCWSTFATTLRIRVDQWSGAGGYDLSVATAASPIPGSPSC